MYKVDPPGPGDHLALHLAIDGWALFREGDEAKLQAATEEKRKVAADEARKEAQKQVVLVEMRVFLLLCKFDVYAAIVCCILIYPG